LYSQPQQRIDIAKGAFFENTPIVPGAEGQLWDSFRWGDTAEFFVLDSRMERKVATAGTDSAVYLSPEQLGWLEEGLKNSRAHFKVVLNSVPMIAWPELWALQDDRWQGYDSQREQLLSHIDAHDIKNVWFLSGDFHVGCIGRIEAEGKRRRMYEILVGPGGNGPNPLQAYVELGGDIDDVFPKEQFPHYNWGFASTRITFDPQSNSVKVRFVDASTEQVLYDAELRQDES
jgi:phosphodiesterase/alkaline phosphatase D-like protein